MGCTGGSGDLLSFSSQKDKGFGLVFEAKEIADASEELANEYSIDSSVRRKAFKPEFLLTKFTRAIPRPPTPLFTIPSDTGVKREEMTSPFEAYPSMQPPRPVVDHHYASFDEESLEDTLIPFKNGEESEADDAEFYGLVRKASAGRSSSKVDIVGVISISIFFGTYLKGPVIFSRDGKGVFMS
ncbi:hypothetical protein HDU67_009138 [Dinochytrium kinnereticum]|nr:hypothetical protein HDU67_009138 [Dinochytrium kinnereticum]